MAVDEQYVGHTVNASLCTDRALGILAEYVTGRSYECEIIHDAMSEISSISSICEKSSGMIELMPDATAIMY